MRLRNQQLTVSDCKTVREVVAHLGAMQAQDISSAKWAVGIRLPRSTKVSVEEALSKGEVIRTHVLRPTWHLVTSEDVHWILELTAPKIKAAVKHRQKFLGLSTENLDECFKVIQHSLRNQKSLTREELVKELEAHKINTKGDNRAAHIFLAAELEGLICSGKNVNDRTTYALLSERVPHLARFNKDEAILKLTERYFKSHGPATLEDFTWWSGTTLKEARDAIKKLDRSILSEIINSRRYWFFPGSSGDAYKKQRAVLLPAYDEWIISYRDREAFTRTKDVGSAISSNGVFRPVIVINGLVSGLWKRSMNGEKIVVEIDLFSKASSIDMELIEKAVSDYGVFLQKQVEFKIVR